MISKEDADNLLYKSREELVDMLCTQSELVDDLTRKIEALQQKSCNTCKYYDTERPKSHPNYAECNNRNSPLSYVEVNYNFCCNMYIKK